MASNDVVNCANTQLPFSELILGALALTIDECGAIRVTNTTDSGDNLIDCSNNALGWEDWVKQTLGVDANGNVAIRLTGVNLPCKFSQKDVEILFDAVTGVDQTGGAGVNFFTLAGPEWITGLVPGQQFNIVGSTGNDGTYTVVSTAANVGDTDVIVVEVIPDGTGDGDAQEIVVLPHACNTDLFAISFYTSPGNALVLDLASANLVSVVIDTTNITILSDATVTYSIIAVG